MIRGFRAILFDAADTLFYIKNGLGKTYAEPAKKYGINPDPQDLKRAFSKYFSSAPPLAFQDVTDGERKVLERKWWYELVRNVYDEVGIFDQFDSYFDDLFEVFRTSAWEIYPETIDVLTRLRQEGYQIIIVSNFDSRVYDVCNRLGITELLHDFIISSEVGYAKPDIEIYRFAVGRNGLKPSECLFVGDNYLKDYVAPLSIGMDAVLLNRTNNNDIYNVRSIKNLYELF